jgi:hypothetical protein
LTRTIVGALATLAGIAHIVVLATLLHATGLTPFLLMLMLHVSFGLVLHRVALHALPPLRVSEAMNE